MNHQAATNRNCLIVLLLDCTSLHAHPQWDYRQFDHISDTGPFPVPRRPATTSPVYPHTCPSFGPLPPSVWVPDTVTTKNTGHGREECKDDPLTKADSPTATFSGKSNKTMDISVMQPAPSSLSTTKRALLAFHGQSNAGSGVAQSFDRKFGTHLMAAEQNSKLRSVLSNTVSQASSGSTRTTKTTTTKVVSTSSTQTGHVTSVRSINPYGGPTAHHFAPG